LRVPGDKPGIAGVFLVIRLLRYLIGSLSTGSILPFFSERLFWARARPGDSLGNGVQTGLAYSLMAFVLLSTVRYFRVRSLEAWFLSGACRLAGRGCLGPDAV
jgi:hypothetical protein